MQQTGEMESTILEETTLLDKIIMMAKAFWLETDNSESIMGQFISLLPANVPIDDYTISGPAFNNRDGWIFIITCTITKTMEYSLKLRRHKDQGMVECANITFRASKDMKGRQNGGQELDTIAQFLNDWENKNKYY